MKNLYIVGAGGFGRETLWLVERVNQVEQTWNICGFIDDNEQVHGKEFGGYPVLGGCDYFADCSEEVWVVVAIGSAKVKRIVVDKLSAYQNLHFATLIDPAVIMSEDMTVGEGCILCAGSVFTVNITLGKHVIVNLNCTVGHDSVLEDYVTVYPGVNVSGCVRVGAESELGTGMQIIQGMNIGKRSILGAGAVVVGDIPQGCTAVGIPAKPIKFHEENS